VAQFLLLLHSSYLELGISPDYLTEYCSGVPMEIKGRKGSGVKLLKERYRKNFRIPENIDHYSKEDFKKAEKKYVKLCLLNGNCK
jgi:hypothetical protein